MTSKAPASWHSHRPVWLAGIVVLMVLLLAGGGYAIGRTTSAPTNTAVSVQSHAGTPSLPPMMRWARAHHFQMGWARTHQGDLTWMREHYSQWMWARQHWQRMASWMRAAHPGLWAWMRRHGGRMGPIHDWMHGR